MYRKIKKDLNTESYVASRRSVGVRRIGYWWVSGWVACHSRWRLVATWGSTAASGVSGLQLWGGVGSNPLLNYLSCF